ncbi:unnamed protein product [Amaranthus hypochondriacus]
MPRVDGPFQVIAKFGDNAYKIDLPSQYSVSPLFNVGDLQPYNDEAQLGTFQQYNDEAQLGTIVPEGGGNEPNPSPNEGALPNRDHNDTPHDDNFEDTLPVGNFDDMDIHGLAKRNPKILVIFNPEPT